MPSQQTEHNHLSSKEASLKSGYTTDYIARLCRDGDISCRRIGRSWLVDEQTLDDFIVRAQIEKQERTQELARQRRQTYQTHSQEKLEPAPSSPAALQAAEEALEREAAARIFAELVAAIDPQAVAAPFSGEPLSFDAFVPASSRRATHPAFSLAAHHARIVRSASYARSFFVLPSRERVQQLTALTTAFTVVFGSVLIAQLSLSARVASNAAHATPAASVAFAHAADSS
jgi:hypothetical protein